MLGIDCDARSIRRVIAIPFRRSRSGKQGAPILPGTYKMERSAAYWSCDEQAGNTPVLGSGAHRRSARRGSHRLDVRASWQEQYECGSQPSEPKECITTTSRKHFDSAISASGRWALRGSLCKSARPPKTRRERRSRIGIACRVCSRTRKAIRHYGGAPDGAGFEQCLARLSHDACSRCARRSFARAEPGNHARAGAQETLGVDPDRVRL